MSQSPRRGALIESLEVRQLFHNVLVAPVPDQSLSWGQSAVNLDLSNYIDNQDIDGTVVEINTSIGAIRVELFDDATPQTVANFLQYISSGRYNNTIVHRTVPDFVVQLGGYNYGSGELESYGPFVKDGQQLTSVPLELPTYTHIETFGTVPNEFASSPRDAQNRVNVRGTVAMAKIGEQPDSATSEFFFNLSDNNSGSSPNGLDFQNGGFTTFGRVVQGMDVVDAMVNVSDPVQPTEFTPYYNVLTNASPYYPFSAMPMRDYEYEDGLPTTAQAVVINSVNVASENTYTLSSSNPAVVNPSVTGSTLSLLPGGAAGTTTITVIATTPDGDVLTDSFDVTVTASVTIGDGTYKSVQYVDADGTKVTATLNKGQATFNFSGENLQITPGSRGLAVVGGTNVALASATLTGTDAATTFKVTAGGGADGSATIGDIDVDGSLRAITATRSILTGDVTAVGYVGSASFLGITGGSITVGATAGESDPRFALKTGAITDGSLAVTGEIKSITASSWTTSDAQGESLSASTIGTINVKGDFSPSVTTTAGGITSASVTGNVASPNWNVAGAVAKLTAGAWNNAGGTDSLDAASLGRISVKGNFGPDVTTSGGGIASIAVAGAISAGTWNITGGATTVSARETVPGWTGVFSDAVGTFSVKGTLDGALAARSIKTLKAATLSAPVTVSATDGFALTTVSLGTMVDAEIRSAGDIRSISVKKGVFGSGIYIAVASDALTADAPTDFTSGDKKIHSASFTNARGQVAFQDSAVVAPIVTKLSLGTIADNASAAPFNGIATDVLTAVTFTLDGARGTVRNAADTASATQQLQSAGFNPQNFVVRVV